MTHKNQSWKKKKKIRRPALFYLYAYEYIYGLDASRIFPAESMP